MNLALWIAAGLLPWSLWPEASVRRPYPEKLAAQPGGEWAGDATVGSVKTLGILELLAAAGLTLPAVLDFVPVMVPVTAVCWVLLMIGAMTTHSHYGQAKFVLLNTVYLALAVFVAWGRFAVEPFTA